MNALVPGLSCDTGKNPPQAAATLDRIMRTSHRVHGAQLLSALQSDYVRATSRWLTQLNDVHAVHVLPASVEPVAAAAAKEASGAPVISSGNPLFAGHTVLCRTSIRLMAQFCPFLCSCCTCSVVTLP
jgi:hypothetical protein